MRHEKDIAERAIPISGLRGSIVELPRSGCGLLEGVGEQGAIFDSFGEAPPQRISAR